MCSIVWQNEVSTFLMVDEVTMALQDPALLPDPLLLQDRYFYESSGSNPVRNPLRSQLETYDRLTRYSTFSTESFDCGICLETKKGARCFRIRSCNHLFCSDCLHSFFELNIREGLVKNVCCADMECVNQRGKGDEIRGTVELDEIEEIVGKDLLERYKWLMEKQEIESGEQSCSPV
jgi:E3 ubiquitin-protein ligase RNF14